MHAYAYNKNCFFVRPVSKANYAYSLDLDLKQSYL